MTRHHPPCFRPIPMLVLVLSLSAIVCAQESAATSVDGKAAARNSAPGAENAQVKSEQRRQAFAGLLAIAGIAIAGIGLATVTILWGARVRRETRKSFTPTAPRDDLWFLRPPKSPPPPGNESSDSP